MVNPSKTIDKKAAIGSNLLDVENLKVYYNTVAGVSKAVDGVNLNIKRGEILGIAGESGCGKSTLTTALLRLTRPPAYIAGGAVTYHPIDGSSVDLMKISDSDLRAYRWRNISYLPQGSMNSLNPVIRIEEQFSDVIREHSDTSKREIREMVPELLRQVGLDPQVARMFPHELSGGMKQRVIIAMSVALHSDLVIADEPTTALDVHIQRVVIQTLVDLRDRLGMTVVIVTHDMAVHAELADRVAVMYAGNMIEVGEVRQIFKEPKHPYTQGLIGSIPRVGGARVRLEGIAGNTPSPLNWPSGCRFHPRCPHRFEPCDKEVPQLLPVSVSSTASGNVQGLDQRPVVACHLYTHKVPGGENGQHE